VHKNRIFQTQAREISLTQKNKNADLYNVFGLALGVTDIEFRT